VGSPKAEVMALTVAVKDPGDSDVSPELWWRTVTRSLAMAVFYLWP
jgi:hypothetical protein